VLQTLPTFPTPNIDFSSLPYDIRIHVEQAASFYGLTGTRMHQLALLEQFRLRQNHANKRQKVSTDISMSSHYAADTASENVLEKPPQPRHLVHGASGTARDPSSSVGGSFPPTFEASRLADGLANIKLIVCQSCLARCDSQDGLSKPPSPQPDIKVGY
jgi:hypothetical protein